MPWHQWLSSTSMVETIATTGAAMTNVVAARTDMVAAGQCHRFPHRDTVVASMTIIEVG